MTFLDLGIYYFCASSRYSTPPESKTTLKLRLLECSDYYILNAIRQKNSRITCLSNW